jgi:hypothetical protein
MLRVLGEIQHGPFQDALKDEVNDLTNWVGEIHDGMFGHVQKNNLFLNYADAANGKSFADAASTALLAATVYRLNLLAGKTAHLAQADKMRQTLFASDGSHVGSDGWLTPVVDPDNVGQQGSHSPEAQAFVLELPSAWRDWNATTGGKINAARSVYAPTVLVAAVVMAAASVLGC